MNLFRHMLAIARFLTKKLITLVKQSNVGFFVTSLVFVWLLTPYSHAAVPAYENSTPNVTSILPTGATINADLSEDGTVYYVVIADGAGAPSVSQVQNGQDSTGSAGLASGSFGTTATIGSDAFSGLTPATSYDLYIVAEDLIGPNVQASPTKVDFTTVARDSNSTVTAATTFASPVPMDTAANSTAGTAVLVFDFTITDPGGDGLPTEISEIYVHEIGSTSNSEVSRFRYLLNGPDVTDDVGFYLGATHTIDFTGLNISVPDGGSETYSVSAYFWGAFGVVLTEGRDLFLSVDGDSDFTVSPNGTQMAASTSFNNGAGAVISIVATQLQFNTQPAGSVSGIALTTQPVVRATDANGFIDADFTETITLTEASAGSLTGNAVAAVGGVATFTSLTYSATTDQESFVLTANDQDAVDSDLATVDSSSVTSDVVATQLVFTSQPAPTTFNNGVSSALTTVPVLVAQDADGLTDTGYTTDITLSEVNGAGTVTMSATSDNDVASNTVTLTPTSGSVSFDGLTIEYQNSSELQETFNLQASSGGLTTANSTVLTSDAEPVVTAANISISGATGTGGAYRIGDTITATWDNSATGDDNNFANPLLASVTVDFTDFGGPSSVTATESSDLWSASYVIAADTIDAVNANVEVTVAYRTPSTNRTDDSNATVDTVAPTVTTGAISLTGDSGNSGEFISGDTVTVSWNNTVSGDNNSDTIDAVSVNFSSFGGPSAVSATNGAGTWTASYTPTSGTIEATNLNATVTAIDNAGNSTVLTDNANATVDNIAPNGHSVSFDSSAWNASSASSTSFTFSGAEVGATYQYQISSSAGGTNVTSSGTITSATQQITGIDTTGLNDGTLTLSVTLTDAAGNAAGAVTDTSVKDIQAPTGHGVSFDSSAWNASSASSASFTFSGAEVGATYQYQISSSAGGTNVTSSGTITSATQQITGIDTTGLNDGTLTLSVTLTDAAGNAAGAVTDTSVKDIQAPTGHGVSFDSSAWNASSASSASFTFSGAEVGATYQYQISSSAGGTNVTSSGTITSATQQITGIDTTGLNDGTLTLSVTLTDAAGNAAGAVTDTSVKDIQAPNGHSVSFTDALINATEATASAFSFSGAEIGSTYNFTIASSGGGTNVTGSGSVTSASQAVSAIDVSALNDGTLTLSATLTDSAGNLSTTANATTQLDKTAPLMAANSAVSVLIDTQTNISNSNLMATDAASTTSTLVYEITINTTQGTLANNGTVLSTGSTFTQADIDSSRLQYTHTANTLSADSVTFTITDAAGNALAGQTFTINITDNTPPSISGTPATTVNAGVAYNFMPSASDVNAGDTLTFSISNQPSWASFDAATGRLSGTPAESDIAMYSSIVIRVSDGRNTTSLAPFSIQVTNALDTDGDGVTDPQEGIDGTDPNDANDYLDTTAPSLTAPADVVLDASGLLTTVTVAELLGLAANATNIDIDAQLAMLANDNIDGADCCSPQPQGLSNGVFTLAPGLHTMTWQATDNKGNTATAEQTLRIRPLVSLSQNTSIAEGNTATVTVFLNGPAPDYPFQVPVIIDSNVSTVTAEDHNFTDTLVTFLPGETEKQLTVSTHTDSTQEQAEQLILMLDDQTTATDDLSGGYDPDNINIYDINAGTQSSMAITISSDNFAPSVTLVFEQKGQPTIKVSPNDGLVTVKATVTDLNNDDTFTYQWNANIQSMTDVDEDADTSTFQFNPADITTQQYVSMQVTVTDSAGETDTSTAYSCTVDSVPELRSTQDSDEDGRDDLAEGLIDDDGDGIANYLDNISAQNILPASQGIRDSDLLECEPGTLCRLGKYALCGDNNSARLDNAVVSSLNENETYNLVGGVYDFEIHNLSSPGASSRIVIPLTETIPVNAQYQKYINGTWSTFVEDANNQLHSAPGSLGVCPPPGDTAWQPGLNAGHYCLQLTIEDGGPNDSDGIANGVIEDPGAIGATRSFAYNGSGIAGTFGLFSIGCIGGLLLARRKDAECLKKSP